MQNKRTNKKPKVRLTTHITPLEYDIKLHPDLENFTFSGIETIKVKITKPEKKLVLHSKELDIETVSVEFKKEKIFGTISYQESTETVIFSFPKALIPGTYSLHVVFRGILNDKMRGFYRSSYVYEGKVHNLATTQFEATDARRAFPCFDEPAHKAVFHVSLVVPKGNSAISNTLPISKIEHEAGFEVVRFAPTPKMSTYLLAFLVGNFEYLEGKTKRDVLVRVYTTPGKKHQAAFALECAIKTLEFYEEYFDITYPLNTLDMIAIPDFASGAMENWGAITYRESMLLVDKDKTSTAARQWIALVIAHELAHQWFGNLVTMEWWTHLWLNEGFASYIEYLAVDKLFPKWDIWTQFATHDFGVALRLDALEHTHAIEIPVHHPDEIGEIFDAVSYSKGASVIRMLAQYLGEEKFRDGLRYYLKKHSYKNTETVHLWEAFEKISKKPVRKIMHNWTSKPGHPVVEIHETKKGIVLTQKRFFASPVSAKKSKNKTLWQIPVSITDENGSIFTTLLDKKQTVLQNTNAKYIKLNNQETSFHRSTYSHELLMKLKDPVASRALPPVDRIGIIRDLFAGAEAGLVPTVYVLEFLEAYKEEDNYIVWTEIGSGLSKLNQLYAGTKLEEKLQAFTRRLYTPIFKKLTWDKKEKDVHITSLLRTHVISKLGHAGDKSIVTEARNRFALIEKGEKVDADLHGVIYSLFAHYGGEKEYKKLLALYKKETLHEEKNRIGYALADFTQKEILCDTIHFAFSKDVRPQDTVGILTSIASNTLGRDIWITAIKTNWDTLISRYGDGGYTLGRLLGGLSVSPHKKHLDFYKNFFKIHPAPGAARSIEQTKERIESNILWAKRDAKTLDKFLSKE
ncbi:MAG: M1 family metallopeptidase [Candidatus Paceibacterota bacterium]